MKSSENINPKPKKQVRLVTAKEVAVILKVSPEVVTYLRTCEKLPFVKNSKYILFSEPEVVRWRNRKLTEDGKVVMNLKTYYDATHLIKFITYEDFYKQVQTIAFTDGDNVLQYIKRQNTEKNVIDLVGDIISKFWEELSPKCNRCGKTIRSTLPDQKYCFVCLGLVQEEAGAR